MTGRSEHPTLEKVVLGALATMLVAVAAALLLGVYALAAWVF